MLRAQFFRTTRRMQGITQQHQARDVIGNSRRNLRRDASPHRLAADHQLLAAEIFMKTSVMKRRNDLSKAQLELIIPVGNAPAILAVDEIECDGINAPLR